MNLQLTHTTTATAHSQFKKRYLAAVAGAALAVATVAGIGAWQAASHETTARTVSAPVSVAAPSTGSAPTLLSQPLPQMIYYLVGSQEQAEIDQHVGGSDPSQSMVIVDSSAAKTLLNGAGQGYVVDLRPSAPAPAAP